MKLEPLGDRIVVKLLEEQEQKVGSIIIPDTAKEKPQTGEVIAVGNDEEVQESLKTGDRVIFAKYGGHEVDIDGETQIIMSFADVLAKVIT